MVKSTANQVPTLAESESAQAMPPSAATTRAAMPSCRRRAHQFGQPAAQADRPLLDQAAQDQHGADGAHIQQRRQAEEQRGQQAGSQAGGDRAPGKFKLCMNRQQLAEDGRQRGHDAHAGGHADKTAGEAEAQGLQQKDAQQIGGAGADGLQDGQHVHALLQVRVHGHGHADCAEHHGHQADQAEDGGGVVQALAQRRIAFAVVHHLRVGQRGLDLLAQSHGVGLGRQLHQQALAGAAAGGDQAGGGQRRLRDHHARTHRGHRGHAVRLLLEDGRDAEVAPAQPQRLADVGIQADEKLLGDDG